MKLHNKEQAFSLMEMLVSVTILIIMLGIVLYAYTNLSTAGSRATRLIEMHNKSRLLVNKIEELVMNRAPTMAFVAEDRHVRYANMFSIDSAYDDNSTGELWGVKPPQITLIPDGPYYTTSGYWTAADDGGTCWSIDSNGVAAQKKTKVTRYEVDGAGDHRSYGYMLTWSPVAASWNSSKTTVTDTFTTSPRGSMDLATPKWRANQSWGYGETVCDPGDDDNNDNARRYIYMCISDEGGQSGGTTPDFPKAWGETVTEESTGLVWKCVPPHSFINADVDWRLDQSSKRCSYNVHRGMSYYYFCAPSVFLTSIADVYVETSYWNPVANIDTTGDDGLRGRWNRSLDHISYYGNDPRGGEMPGHPRWVKVKFVVVSDILEGEDTLTLDCEQVFHTRY